MGLFGLCGCRDELERPTQSVMFNTGSTALALGLSPSSKRMNYITHLPRSSLHTPQQSKSLLVRCCLYEARPNVDSDGVNFRFNAALPAYSVNTEHTPGPRGQSSNRKRRELHPQFGGRQFTPCNFASRRWMAHKLFNLEAIWKQRSLRSLQASRYLCFSDTIRAS